MSRIAVQLASVAGTASELSSEISRLAFEPEALASSGTSTVGGVEVDVTVFEVLGSSELNLRSNRPSDLMDIRALAGGLPRRRLTPCCGLVGRFLGTGLWAGGSE